MHVVQSAVLLSLVVRSSVTLRCRDRIGWTSSKLITRVMCLGSWRVVMHAISKHVRLSERTTKVWMKTDPYYQRQRCSPMILICGNIMADRKATSDWRDYILLLVCNYVGLISSGADNVASESPEHGQIPPPWIRHCGNIRFMQIFTGVPWRGGVKGQWCNPKRRFSGLSDATLSASEEMRPTLLHTSSIM